MNRGTIKSTVRKVLGETTAVFWTDDDLNQWAEDGQLDIVWNARCNRQRDRVSATADTVRYTLSNLVSNVLRVYKVRVYNSSTEKWRMIPFKTEEYLDNKYPQWSSADDGTPLLYTYHTDLDEFILYPKADEDHYGDAGGDIEIYSSVKPIPMAGDGNSPDFEQQLHPALINYIVAVALASRGYQDIADNYWAKYYAQIRGYITEKRFEEDDEVIMHAAR